ncbi:MAG TPA: 30S ribosomal protein S4e [Candidatus Thermoplasmatota archaeon]|nr:30S ribosomal protein S4e [Candidatus Thermoplasmatota archaeon]
MSLHLKRLASPRVWSGTVPRKAYTWAPKTRPGPHAADRSIPMALILRDYLKVADTLREAKRVLGAREVLVDGKVVTDHKRGVGFMDVISLPKTEKHYRVMLDTRGRLVLTEIPAAAAAWKLCRVENKTTVAGGKFQLNLHDGRNIVVKEAAHKTGDVLKVHLPDQKVMGALPLAAGHTVLITGGKHIGQTATVGGVEKTRNPRPNVVSVKSGDVAYATIKPYVFVIGKDKAEVALPEVA